MKYLLEFWVKEPVAENMAKVLAIEAERTKKGENLSPYFVLPQHYLLSEPRAIMIAETENINKVAKWAKDYMALMSYKISPMMERSEFDKL